MTEFVLLSCPACGGKLEITPDIDRFACSYCGQEHVIKRSKGIVSIAPVVDAIHQVRTGVDRTAAELGIVRLKSELDSLYAHRAAVLENNPPPAAGALALLCVIGGFVFGCAGVFLMILPHETTGSGIPLAAIVIGLALIAFGGLDLRSVRPNTERWNRTTGLQVKSLDDQIASKQAELARLQRVVAS